MGNTKEYAPAESVAVRDLQGDIVAVARIAPDGMFITPEGIRLEPEDFGFWILRQTEHPSYAEPQGQ